MNKVLRIFCVSFLWTYVFIFLGKYLQIELLCHSVDVSLTL